MRRTIAAALSAALLLGLAGGSVAAGNGPPALSFYVDGALYRTIGAPTDLSGTGAPDRSYDAIYALGGSLMNVSEAKPGDRDYNGGRWQVFPVEWHVTPVQLKSAEQVLAYDADGKLTVSDTSIQSFVCPVIHVSGS